MMKVSKVSANWRLLISPQHFCLQEYGKDILQTLISFYGSEQQVALEGKARVSKLGIDRQSTEYRVESILNEACCFHSSGCLMLHKPQTATPMICKKLLVCLQTVLWIQPFQTYRDVSAWLWRLTHCFSPFCGSPTCNYHVSFLKTFYYLTSN